MKIKSTSSGNPSATIRSEGEPIPLKEFKVRRGRVTKVQVVKSGSMKPLVYQRSGIKMCIRDSHDDAVRYIYGATGRRSKRAAGDEPARYGDSVPGQGGRAVSYTHLGIDVRLATPERIEMLNRMRIKRVHMAWDQPDQDLTEDFKRFSECRCV